MKAIKIKLLAIIPVVSLLFFISCDKHEDGNVQINITQPLASSTYHLNDTVKMRGTITADVEMHGYEVKIKNLTAGTIVFITDYHEHGSSFTINEDWINNVTEHSDMRLVVKVEVDHSGTEVSDSLNFHCHPM